MDVAETISKWTDEERKRFKDLIDECTEREELINNCKLIAKQKLIKLNKEIEQYLSSLDTLSVESKKLLDYLELIHLKIIKPIGNT